MRRSEFLVIALSFAAAPQCFAQDVVSASSGVLQYFEGQVTLDGSPVEHKAAVFPSLKNGSTIRTGKGRAELLLTPGVYLRMDENSELQMQSNSLTDTRITAKEGTVILDNLNAPPGDVVSLTYHEAEIRFPHPGIYRLDTDVDELQAYSGDCLVKSHGATATVDSTHRYYLSLEMSTPKSSDSATDEFYDWAANRGNVLSEQNQLASADQADPDPNGASGMFVVPPVYSAPVYATPTVAYSSFSPLYSYQPALFNNFIYVVPYRYLVKGTLGNRWPTTTTAGYRPVITRWPTSTTTYRPPVTTYKPATSYSGQHVYTPAPRVAVPRIGVIGHH